MMKYFCIILGWHSGKEENKDQNKTNSKNKVACWIRERKTQNKKENKGCIICHWCTKQHFQWEWNLKLCYASFTWTHVTCFPWFYFHSGNARTKRSTLTIIILESFFIIIKKRSLQTSIASKKKRKMCITNHFYKQLGHWIEQNYISFFGVNSVQWCGNQPFSLSYTLSAWSAIQDFCQHNNSNYLPVAFHVGAVWVKMVWIGAGTHSSLFTISY